MDLLHFEIPAASVGNGNQEVVIKRRRRAWFTLSAMIDRRRYSTTLLHSVPDRRAGIHNLISASESRNRSILTLQSIEDAKPDCHRLGGIG